MALYDSKGKFQGVKPPTTPSGGMSGGATGGLYNSSGQYNGGSSQSQPQGQPQGQPWSAGGFAGNVVSSGANLIGGAVSGIANVFNPNMEQNTIANLGSTALGGVQKLGGADNANTQKFDAIGQFFQDRYGISDILQGKLGSGVNKIANTMYSDPVGFLADLSSVIGGAGVVAGGVGKVANIGRAGEIAGSLTKVSDYLNPLSLRTKTQALRDVGIMKPLETQGGQVATKASKLAGGIEESNLRLTQKERGVLLENPKIKVQIKRASSKVPPGGIPEQYAYANEIVQGIDEVRQAAFKTYDAYGETPFSRDAVVAKMEALKSKYTQGAESAQELSTIDKYIEAFKKVASPSENPSVPQYSGGSLMSRPVISPKLGWYAMEHFKSTLWNAAKFTDQGYVTKGIAADLGHMFKGLIDETAEKRGLMIGDIPYAKFNAEYSDILTYQTYLEHALGRPEIGSITARLLGGILGSSLGGGGGAALGAALAPGAVSQLPLSAIKSYVAKGLRQLPQTKSPTVSIPGRVGLGARGADLTNQASSQQFSP